MNVLLYSRDLAVISQVDGAAARSGVTARSVSTVEDAVAAVAGQEFTIAIIDLTSDVDVEALVPRILTAAGTPLRIVAYGPHVHVDRLASAERAGCEVLTRGQFFSQLPRLLSV